MTRTLWKFLLALTMASMIGGCSLFGGDDDNADAGLESESVSSSDVVLDAEDEMLAESEDLESEDLDGDDLDEGDEFSEGDDFGEEEVAEGDSGLDDEFESAGLEPEDDDEDFGGEDDEFEISQTSDDAVDPDLAQDELDEFSEFGEEGDADDEFALEAEPMDEDPVFDEPADNPIVDVPQDGMVASSGANQIKNLEYKAFENGGTVVIETSSPANYQKFIDPDLNQVVIQVNDAFLPERFKRPYVTKDFKQDIATINAYTDDTGAARFVIQLKRPIEPVIQQEGNSILVMTSGGAPMQQASTGGDEMMDPGPNEESLDALVSNNQMDIKQGVSPSQRPSAGQSGMSASMRPNTGMNGSQTIGSLNKGSRTNNVMSKTFGGSEKSGLALNPTNFTGEKINLEYIDEDVRAIIQDITDRSGVNLIMDREVEGKTSIRLRNVPWDQALLVLLRSEGLGYVKQGTVLRIAKQDTLSKEAQAVSSQIKNEKTAKLLSGGIKVKYIPVSYAKVDQLAGKLKDFTSKEGKIAFDDRTSSLVLTDYGEYIDRIQDLVKALDSPPMQVEIESKLVEAREDFIREAGINWDINGQDFPFGSQTGNLNTSLSSNNLPSQGFSLDLSVGTFDIFGDLQASLSVFESANKIKVLSQPRVVTMNKVEALIEQTTQIPISTTTITPGAPALQQFSFVDLVLSLKVTPQITFKGDVILDVELKREFAGSANADGSRELNKRRAKSTVMVKNGKTAVIGGIYQLDDGDLETGIPLLKDIPLLGYLFKQIRTEKIKNELLLFLKPKILREIDGPMVSKTGAPGPNYDPFEELSVDEGGTEELEDEGDESESDLEGELEDFEDEEESFDL